MKNIKVKIAVSITLFAFLIPLFQAKADASSLVTLVQPLKNLVASLRQMVASLPGQSQLAQVVTSENLGNTTPGGLNVGAANTIGAARFTMPSEDGTLVSVSAYFTSSAASPNDQFRAGVYEDSGGVPGNLVASSDAQTISANSWNTVSVSGSLNANATYWLAFITNGISNIAYSNSTGVAYYHNQTFGAMPSSFGAGTVANYSFSIYATYNTAGGVSDTTAPTTPTNLSATAVSSSRINLSWTASTDSVGVTGYRIYRGGVQIGTSATNSYSDTSLSASTAYTYTVAAYDAAGNLSSQSSSASATTQAPSTAESYETLYGITIPASHPRLWFGGADSARLASAREWYQSNSFTPSNLNAVINAEENALLALLSQNSSYCGTAVDWALSQTRNFNVGGTSSNDARWYGEEIVLVWDWCYDYMTEAGRVADRNEIMETWNSYNNTLRQRSWGGPTMIANNYHWGYLRNELLWAIASFGESDTQNDWANTFFEDALETRFANNFIPYGNDQGQGGVPVEGYQYGRYLLDYPVVPFTSMETLGRQIFEETDFYKEAVYYLVYATTPQSSYTPGGTSGYQTFPHSDDQYWNYGRNAEDPTGNGGYNLGDFMTAAANNWSSYSIGRHAQTWLDMVSPTISRFARATDGNTSSLSFGSLPLDYYAPGPGYVYGRNQWGTGSTLYNLQLGNDAYESGHDHQDSGNWQIWRNGRWLSRESVGYQGVANHNIVGYNNSGSTGANDPVAHNTILVDGRGPVQTYPTTDVPVSRLESRDDYMHASVDLADLYGGEATNVEREYFFIRPLETMVIFDRINAPAGVNKTFIAHFETSPSIDDVSDIVTAANGSEELRMITLLPSDPTYRTITEGGSIGQYRLETETSGSAQTYFLNVLQAKSASGSDLTATVTDNGSSYTVTLTHPSEGTATLVLNKGATSSGGTVTVSGTTYTLLDRVQDISVTNSGPVWENIGDGSPTTPSSSTFSAGDRVQTTSNLNVRATASASGTLLGTQSLGALGTIVSGGTYADGYYWWNVNYDSGVDGYSIENYLQDYTAPSADTTAPTVTAFVIPLTASSLTVSITNFVATDAVGVTGYMVTESSSAPSSSSASWSASAPASYTFASAGSKTLYAWAKDAAGNVSASRSDSVTITLPTYSIGGTVSGLSGTLVLQNNGGDNLSRSANGSFTFSTTLSSGSLYSATILTQPSGQSCTISNGSGTVSSANISNISVSCVNVVVPDTTAPTTPTNLSATAVSGSQINLSWTASTDAVGVTGYRVYRSGAQIGTSASNSYSDTGLSASTQYSYTVSAYDAAGNVSSQSSSASATTQESATPPSTTFTTGQRVQTTSNLNVRATASASGTLLGTQSLGALGTIVSGGTYVNGQYWWYVNYDSGADGYSSETHLQPYSVTSTKQPKKLKLNSLEGKSLISSYPQATIQILSGSTVLETQTLNADGSGNYTVDFGDNIPTSVSIRMKVFGYLSKIVAGVNTESETGTAEIDLIAGDLSGDDRVNSLDFSLLNSRWGESYSPYDFNDDGVINALDYSILLGNWHKVGE